MALTGNIGEWSEIYVHLRLLADGVLYSGDEKLKKIINKYLKIIKIFRTEKGFTEDNVYDIDAVNSKIFKTGNGNNIELLQSEFDKAAKSLLKHIQTHKTQDDKKKYEFKDVEKFIKSADIYSLKAKSSDKKDIRMIVHDLNIDMESEMGFSVKSKLGGNSTLFNANKNGTNFLYKITGGITDERIEYLNSLSDSPQKRRKGFFKQWFDLLEEWGYKVEYEQVINPVFASNLRYIDSEFHKILSNCLLLYYSHKCGKNISSIVRNVSQQDPCGLQTENRYDWYEFAMKQFLIIYALGMTANKPWNRKYDANGGYIVVTEKGDIVCYHFYDRVQLENYLFNNTAFDTPSTSRHDFYQIYRDKESDNVYF